MKTPGELNDAVRARLTSDDSREVLETCRRVAADAGYLLVEERGQVERYEDPGGNRVNLWVEDVQGVGFADGGLGFDDQTD